VGFPLLNLAFPGACLHSPAHTLVGLKRMFFESLNGEGRFALFM
jgi:hypothetical protein